MQSLGNGANRFRTNEAKVAEQESLLLTSGKTLAKLATLGNTQYQPDKQTINEYLEKKKEIFKLQMTLNSKQSEIKKLQDRSAHRKEALRKSEAMLDEDVECFENFIALRREKLSRVKHKLQAEQEATSGILHKINSTLKSAAELKVDVQLLKLETKDLPGLAQVVQDMEMYRHLVMNEFSQGCPPSRTLDTHGVLDVFKVLEARILSYAQDPEFALRLGQHSSSWHNDLAIFLRAEISYAQAAIQDAVTQLHTRDIPGGQDHELLEGEQRSCGQVSEYALLCGYITDLYESMCCDKKPSTSPVKQVHYLQSLFEEALSAACAVSDVLLEFEGKHTRGMLELVSAKDECPINMECRHQPLASLGDEAGS